MTRRQVTPAHYAGMGYDSKARYASYWHQVDAVLRRAPRRMLEIGVGNGFVTRCLRQYGIAVDTLDFDAELSPGTTGSVTDLPFRAGSFDLVLCSQVLEHLPFHLAEAALAEIRRVSRAHAVISVPDVTPRVRIMLPVPRRQELQVVMRNWFRRRPQHVSVPEQHEWEMGTRQVTHELFRNVIRRSGLTIVNEFCVFEQPYYHFFELEI